MIPDKIAKILKNLPEIELKRAVISVDNKIYTWNECKDIIEKNEDADLAKKIIMK